MTKKQLKIRKKGDFLMKTIKFSDFMNKTYENYGLTDSELHFFENMKLLLYLLIAATAVPAIISIVDIAETAFLYLTV